MQLFTRIIALMLITTPALTSYSKDVTIEIKGVKLKALKSNGKAWDAKIPFRAKSELPDVFVEVKIGDAVILKTPITQDTFHAVYSGQIATFTRGSKAVVTVWDKDLGKNDSAGSITITNQDGAVKLSGGGVEELEIIISGNADPKPAAPAAPATPAAPAEKPAEPAAPAAPAEEPAEPAAAKPAE